MPTPESEFDAVKQAIRDHGATLAAYPGVIKVQPGYEFVAGRVTDTPAVEVLVNRKLPTASVPDGTLLPKQIGGVRVDVRQASVEEQLEIARRAVPEAEPDEAIAGLVAAVGVVDDRTPIEQETGAAIEAELVEYEKPDFQMEVVEEPMKVILHVSPDDGFPQLKSFLDSADHLSATIFEFEAEHVLNAILEALGSDGTMDFVMHYRGANAESAQALKDELGEDRFTFAWAAVAMTSAVTEAWFPTSYHIKTIVKNHKHLWLSSGNWKDSNQPEDPEGKPRSFLTNHNREWNIIAQSPGLAKQYERFVKFDLAQASEVQAEDFGLEAEPDVFVPVSPAEPEAEWERFEALAISKTLKVRPLISPDNFIKEITKFVKKATQRLYIQNQYMWPTDDSRWEELNEFVRDFSKKSGVDFKVIVRDLNIAKTIKLMKQMKIKLTNVKQLKNTHTKGIIVGDVGISIGSHNWSGDGFLANRDASLIFDDPEVIEYFEEIFLFDYERARDLQLNAPELEPLLAPAGESPPPGMRRVSWSEYAGE